LEEEAAVVVAIKAVAAVPADSLRLQLQSILEVFMKLGLVLAGWELQTLTLHPMVIHQLHLE
jgi:hypothetical protein